MDEEGAEGVVEGVGVALVAMLAVECEGEIEEDGEEETGLCDENWGEMRDGRREGKKRLTGGSENEETPAELSARVVVGEEGGRRGEEGEKRHGVRYVLVQFGAGSEERFVVDNHRDIKRSKASPLLANTFNQHGPVCLSHKRCHVPPHPDTHAGMSVSSPTTPTLTPA